MNATDLAVVHPRTGEILENLDRQPGDTLAEALHAIKNRQAQLKTMAAAVEAELRKRIGPGRRRAILGDWELELGRKREWDGAELEGALNDLKDRGLLTLEEARGVVIFEPKVSGRDALRVLNRLDGDAKAQIAACFEWKPTGLKLARSVELLPTSTVEEALEHAAERDEGIAGDHDGPAELAGRPANAEHNAAGRPALDPDHLFG